MCIRDREWVTDGKPHLAEKLPVGEELTLREITAPEGYEIAEDVKFTLEDTMAVSYTHLDVYKRQEENTAPKWSVRNFPMEKWENCRKWCGVSDIMGRR